jgi:phosphoglycerol transferase MdoB-like AlkP superfamily enzyme
MMSLKKYKDFLAKKNTQLGLLIFINLGFIISIFVKAFYFQGTSKLCTIPLLTRQNLNMFIALFASIMIIFAVVWLLSGRKTTITLLIVNIIISILLFSDALYSRYYDLPIGIYVAIFQIQFLGDIGGSVGSIFKIKDLIFFIDLPLWIYLYVVVRKTKLPKSWKVFGIRIGSAVAVLLISLLVMSKCYSKTNSPMFYFRKDNVAREMGVFYFHYYDIKETINTERNKKKDVTNDEIALIKEMINKQIPNEYTGLAGGKNLIILQLEAFQEFLIGATIEGEEVTPFLNEYIKESLYFNNVYHQISSGNTSDAEFLANNSLHAAAAGANYYLFPFNKYNSLANVLKDSHKYNTFAAHPFDQTFWNRNIAYQSLGFEEFYSLTDFVIDEPRGWSVGDKSFFKQSIDKVVESSNGNPFYLFDVALTSHHPYSAFSDIDLKLGALEGTMTGNYLRAAHYVDSAIEATVEYLKEIGIYDNTVLVIYGDHSGLFDDEAANLTKFVGVQNNDFEWEKLQKVPLIIHVGGSDLNMEVDNIAGQIDILPTIANLMDIRLPFMLGRDLLGTDDNYVVKRAGTVITEKYMYLKSTGEYYDMASGQIIKEVDSSEVNQLYKQLRVSDLIMQRNLQGKLEKVLE